VLPIDDFRENNVRHSDPKNINVTKMGIDATGPAGIDSAERLIIGDEQRQERIMKHIFRLSPLGLSRVLSGVHRSEVRRRNTLRFELDTWPGGAS
jgi:hypothetical protein